MAQGIEGEVGEEADEDGGDGDACCWPTERLRGSRAANEPSSPTDPSSFLASASVPIRRGPQRTSSSTEAPKRAGSWKIMPTRRLSSSGSIAPVGSPSWVHLPRRRLYKAVEGAQQRALSRPRTPVTQTTSPSGTATLTPSRIPVRNVPQVLRLDLGATPQTRVPYVGRLMMHPCFGVAGELFDALGEVALDEVFERDGFEDGA